MTHGTLGPQWIADQIRKADAMSIKEKHLMFVRSTSDRPDGTYMECSSLDGGMGVGFHASVPFDIGRKMEGRWLWVRGTWGGTCEIMQWVPLPARPSDTPDTGIDAKAAARISQREHGAE
jgi:hypothetical protein